MRSGVIPGLGACLVAGCGFQPATVLHDGPTLDANMDAPLDAKTFQDAPALPPSLAVTVMTLGSADLDLTAEGTLDWTHWGYLGTTGFDRKIGGTAISNVGTAPTLSFTGAPFTATWSDGTPRASVAMTSSGVGVQQGSTLAFTVAADPTVRTLRFYVGVQDADARLDVTLDGAQPQTKLLSDNNGVTNVCYTITFNAATTGQSLTVSWTDTHDYGGSPFAALLEATLH
ncbi:MAG: hypothetical protein ABJE66_01100 [Deltaproteobacteria bacterium]